MSVRIIASLAALLPFALAAGSATRPADVWLARAEREIDSIPTEQRDADMPQARELAMFLYRLEPSDTRRARAIRLIDAFLKTDLARNQSAEQIQGDYIGVALAHAQLDDLEGARRFLADADRPTHAPPSTNPSVKLGAGFNQMLRAETEVRLGNFAAFENAGLNSTLAGMLASDLAADGLIDQAKRVDDWMAKQAIPASTQPGGLIALGQRKVQDVESMSYHGDRAGAVRAAAEIADEAPPEAGGVTMGGYYACEAEFAVAKDCVAASDLANFQAARDAFLVLVRKDPSDGISRLPYFLRLCVLAKDRAGFEAVAHEWESELEPLASQAPAHRLEYVEQTAQIAIEGAAIGDLARYHSAVDRAEKVLAGVRSDNETDKSSYEQKPAGFLWIAAARARAGDSAGVARDEAASKQAGPLDPNDWDYAWDNVVEGYAEAGRFEEALAAAALARDDRYKNLPASIARRQAQAGRFADAWNTLAPLPTRARLRGEYDLIVRQVRAGDVAGLDRQIDGISSLAERALADIAVGATLLDRPFVGLLRMYKVKEE